MWSLAAICIPWEDESKRRVALIRRQARCPHPLSGKWCFPGGVVEISEQPVEAAARETKEESGIDVRDFRLLDAYTFRESWKDAKENKHRDVVLVVFEGFYRAGTLAPQLESQEARWIDRSDLTKFIEAPVAKSHLSKKVCEAIGLHYR